MIQIDKLNNNIINKTIDSINLESNGYVTNTNCTINSLILVKHLMNVYNKDEDTIENEKINIAYSNLVNNYD